MLYLTAQVHLRHNLYLRAAHWELNMEKDHTLAMTATTHQEYTPTAQLVVSSLVDTGQRMLRQMLSIDLPHNNLESWHC
jgi:hypothetical protein